MSSKQKKLNGESGAPEVERYQQKMTTKSVIFVSKRSIKSSSSSSSKVRRQKTKSIIALVCGIIIIQLIDSPIKGRTYSGAVSAVSHFAGGRSQDVALDELEASSSGAGTGAANENVGTGTGLNEAEETHSGEDNKMKNLDSLLDELPVLSVGQKHVARFECELSKEFVGSTVKVVWIKLTRGQETTTTNNNSAHQRATAKPLNLAQAVGRDDTKLISLDQKLITPDKRFKVHRQAAYKWQLSIDNVQPEDGQAYYLCQASTSEPSSVARNCQRLPGARAGNSSCLEAQRNSEVARSTSTTTFIGGARLNVLAPPKIVEQETSASQVVANEYETLSLKCKVSSEPQSQLMWKREDNKPLLGGSDGVEQRFRHESIRKPNHQILSIDSSELLFEPFLRIHAGAYLCIASNGIQPGVSQRINVMAVNCRLYGNHSAPGSDSCERLAVTTLPPETTTTPTERPPAAGNRKLWRTSSTTSQQQQQQQPQISGKSVKYRQQAADKRRAQPVASGRDETAANGFGVQVGSALRPMESSTVPNKGNSISSSSVAALTISLILSSLCCAMLHYCCCLRQHHYIQ